MSQALAKFELENTRSGSIPSLFYQTVQAVNLQILCNNAINA